MRLEPDGLVQRCCCCHVGAERPGVDGCCVLTNPDHVVARVVVWGLLFRRTVQRRHFGLPADNDGVLGCEYLRGWVVALFGGACLLVGVADIVARGTILVVRA